MKKKIFIDGNFLLKDGVFFGLNFYMYADKSHQNKADIIISSNKEGIYEVTEDGGSMFNEYYVKGGITMYGQNGSTIKWFKNEHENTYSNFKHIQEQILLLLENAIVIDECKNFFYQQQFISLFANLEYFLYNTFIWETCQCYDSYKRVLQTLAKYINKSKNKKIKRKAKILKGKHCILQEKTFIEQVKHIVYHNASKVKEIYKKAFNIDVDLNKFSKELDIRHDIVHRAGYTNDNELVQMTKEQVISLKEKIEGLVEFITLEIAKFNDNKTNH